MFVKKGDTVIVLSGEDKGKKGKVLVAAPSNGKVIVEGINVRSHHKKARSAQETGGIAKFEAPINASNVQLVCPSCGKPSRASKQIVDGKKVRVCKKCGKVLDGEKEVKKAAAKKSTAAKTSDTVKKAPAKKAEATEVEATPVAAKKTPAKTTAAKTTATEKKPAAKKTTAKPAEKKAETPAE